MTKDTYSETNHATGERRFYIGKQSCTEADYRSVMVRPNEEADDYRETEDAPKPINWTAAATAGIKPAKAATILARKHDQDALSRLRLTAYEADPSLTDVVYATADAVLQLADRVEGRHLGSDLRFLSPAGATDTSTREGALTEVTETLRRMRKAISPRFFRLLANLLEVAR